MLPKATNAALTTRWMVARIRKVKGREPKPVLVPHFQVVDPFQLAGGSGDPVAAFEELLDMWRPKLPVMNQVRCDLRFILRTGMLAAIEGANITCPISVNSAAQP